MRRCYTCIINELINRNAVKKNTIKKIPLAYNLAPVFMSRAILNKNLHTKCRFTNNSSLWIGLRSSLQSKQTTCRRYYLVQVNSFRRVVMGCRHIGQVERLAPQSLQVFHCRKKEKHKHTHTKKKKKSLKLMLRNCQGKCTNQMTASKSHVFWVSQANRADLEQHNMHVKTKSWYK